MEPQKAPSTKHHSEVHWVRLGPSQEGSRAPSRKEVCHPVLDRPLALKGQTSHGQGRPVSPRKTSIRCIDLLPRPALSPIISPICPILPRPPSKAPSPSSSTPRSGVGQLPSSHPPRFDAPFPPRTGRLGLVGGRQHLLWNWHGNQRLLGSLVLGPSVQTRPTFRLRYRLGGGSNCRVGGSSTDPPWLSLPTGKPSLPGSIGQHGCCRNHTKRPLPVDVFQQGVEDHLPPSGGLGDFPADRLRPKLRQSGGPVIEGR
ncbi:hypothetical protein BJ322DRAFT_1116123, partial [Thelephora terrestris]